MATPLPKNITRNQKYGPAMLIEDQVAADEYFATLVEHSLSFGLSREEAERMERTNLGYFAGYYSHSTRARVERLFRCAHPILGAIAEWGAPTPKEALAAGLALGRAHREKRD